MSFINTQREYARNEIFASMMSSKPGVMEARIDKVVDKIIHNVGAEIERQLEEEKKKVPSINSNYFEPTLIRNNTLEEAISITRSVTGE